MANTTKRPPAPPKPKGFSSWVEGEDYAWDRNYGAWVHQQPDGAIVVWMPDEGIFIRGEVFLAEQEARDAVKSAGTIEKGSEEQPSDTPSWWKREWGKPPMKQVSKYVKDDKGNFVPRLVDEIDIEVAFRIAKWLSEQGEEVDMSQAFLDAIEAANNAAIEAAQKGDTEGARKAMLHKADLKAQYAQWQQSIQPKKAAPSGAFATQAEAQAEAARLGPGYEAVRDPSTGQWFVQLTEEPTEQFLGTVSEGGWDIDQYGYTDANGKTVITKRQPRQPIKEPIESLDDMIAKALVGVDFNDPGWRQDKNYIRAQALRNFQKQPTSQERLQMALQIAQSPSDYLTLTALYTGAIARETPAKVGERIAPLAPFLQELARQFFLDIPGITKVREEPEEALEKRIPGEEGYDEMGEPDPNGEYDANGNYIGSPPAGKAGTTPGLTPDEIEEMRKEAARIVGGGGDLTPDEVARIKAGPPPGWIIGEGGRYYNPDTHQWEPWEDFAARTGVTLPSMSPDMGTGTLSPEEVEAIREEGTSKLQEQYNASAWGESFSTSPTGQKQSAQIPSFQEDEGYGGPKVSLEDIAAYEEIFKQRMAEAKKKKKAAGVALPSFQQGGIVPGIPGFSTLIAAEPGETVMTPEQVRALLQQSGMFGPVYRPGLQELPSFLTAPKTTTISSLTGLRPRSLQTIRRQSPTQRALYKPLVQSFGVPWEDWQEEEQLATSVGGRRPGVRWRLPSMIGLR